MEHLNLFKTGVFLLLMGNSVTLKMAVIAGASKALKLKAENVRWTDEKVLQKINQEVREIIGKLNKEE